MKINIRKYESGGTALPFVDYMPFSGAAGTSRAASDSGSSSSSSSKENDIGLKDLLNLTKELDGLHNDIGAITSNIQKLYDEASITGEVSTSDLVTMYLSTLQKIKVAKLNKEQFNDARTLVTNNGGLHEVAIDEQGLLFVQDNERKKITKMSVDQFRNLQQKDPQKYSALTNSNLLWLRDNDKSMVFRNNVLTTVSNGIGEKAVTEMLQKVVNGIGTETLQKEGYTEKTAGKIKGGLYILQEAYEKGMPLDGLYKAGVTTKDQQEKISKALEYIWKTMPENARAWLQYKSGSTDSQKGALALMSDLLFSHNSTEAKFSLDVQNNSDKIASNPYVQMQRQQGGEQRPLNIVTASGNSGLSVNGEWYGQIPRVDSDMSIDALLATGIQGIVASRDGITFGDQQLGSDALKHILYDNKGGTVATLPCKYDASGNKIVNLDAINDYKKAQAIFKEKIGDKQLSQEESAKIMGDILSELGLTYLLDIDGKPNSKMFGEFLIVDAYTTDKLPLDKSSEFIEKVRHPDKALQEKLEIGLAAKEIDGKKSAYEVDIKDKWAIFEWSYDDIYRANVFIPIIQNQNAAFNAWGTELKDNQVYQKEKDYQLWTKATNANPTSSALLD